MVDGEDPAAENYGKWKYTLMETARVETGF